MHGCGSSPAPGSWVAGGGLSDVRVCMRSGTDVSRFGRQHGRTNGGVQCTHRRAGYAPTLCAPAVSVSEESSSAGSREVRLPHTNARVLAKCPKFSSE